MGYTFRAFSEAEITNAMKEKSALGLTRGYPGVPFVSRIACGA